MIKGILVPLDGSQLAESVLPYVERIAVATGAETTLLNAIYMTGGWGEYPLNIDLGKETTLVQSYLDSQRKELEARGLKVKTEIAYEPPAQAILNCAADKDVDLIAMSTHGRSGITRWVLGSVADKVLHSTHRPLLLVRAKEAAQQEGQAIAINKILVPLDGSELSLAVLPFVEDLAKALGSSLALFHAVAPVGIYTGVEMAPTRAGDLLNQFVAQAHDFLTQVAKEIEQRGLQTDRSVSIGFAADEIVRAAADVQADLIALSTHGRSGLGRWVMGSVADAVVRRTTLPCLVVRPHQAEKEA